MQLANAILMPTTRAVNHELDKEFLRFKCRNNQSIPNRNFIYLKQKNFLSFCVINIKFPLKLFTHLHRREEKAFKTFKGCFKSVVKIILSLSISFRSTSFPHRSFAHYEFSMRVGGEKPFKRCR